MQCFVNYNSYKMISRRDKLLKNPWEQRRYENHLRKINSAVPVIDNKPPVSRQHVTVKLKKRQIEIERMRQVENENLILLRRINHVMSTNRVDNWNIPPQQTKYLNRVPLRSSSSVSRPSSYKLSPTIRNIPTKHDPLDHNHNHLRKSKCLACSPHIFMEKQEDSERIPWEEPKVWSKTFQLPRERSKSLPVIKTDDTVDKIALEGNKSKVLSASSNDCLKSLALKNTKLQKQLSLDNDIQSKDLEKVDKLKLFISSGSLKLCVKFPSDSHITIKNGPRKKTVFGSHKLQPFK